MVKFSISSIFCREDSSGAHRYHRFLPFAVFCSCGTLDIGLQAIGNDIHIQSRLAAFRD